MSAETQIPESTIRAVTRILYPAHTSAVEDVLQNARLAALKTQARFEAKNGSQHSTWFHRIAVNKALEYRRRNWRLLTQEVEDGVEFASFPEKLVDAALNPEERLLAKERNRQLVKALLQLGPKTRQAMLKFAITARGEGLDGYNNTLKTRRHRGLVRLRELLGVPE